MRTREVVRDHHELLDRLAVRCLLLPVCLLSAILDLLDESSEGVLDSSVFSEDDLVGWWDDLVG